MAKAPEGSVPVVVMGLGFVGQNIARAVLVSPELQLVGAVDPGRAGASLGELLGREGMKLKVRARLEEAVGKAGGAVVLHATASRLPQVMDELLGAVRAGCHVVSTCEELTFPYLRHPELAEKLDRAAQKAGVAVLGTGVNPGFVMDRLVATAGQACGPVRHALVERVVDVRTRNEALQRKVGAGLSEEAFFAQLEAEQLGHVGLVESAALCALGLGLDCDDFEEEVAPVLAEEDIPGGAFPVKKGQVAGVVQTVVGTEEGVERVRLELTLAVGADEPRDRFVLDAEPRVELEIRGGLAGDAAMAHAVVNAAPRVAAAEPGLLTVLELPAGR
jgi:2,4-diaminopentanoate dehydrogenase